MRWSQTETQNKWHVYWNKGKEVLKGRQYLPARGTVVMSLKSRHPPQTRRFTVASLETAFIWGRYSSTTCVCKMTKRIKQAVWF